MVRDVLRFAFRLRRLAAFSLTVLSAACAYESPGFDAIDGRRRLSELSSSERALVCDWVDAQANARPPAAPSGALRCTRQRQSISYLDYGGSCPDPRRTQCPTTMLQLRRCIPALFAAVASDGCGQMKVESLDALDGLVKQIPACRGVARCAYHPPVEDNDEVVVRWR